MKKTYISNVININGVLQHSFKIHEHLLTNQNERIYSTLFISDLHDNELRDNRWSMYCVHFNPVLLFKAATKDETVVLIRAVIHFVICI